MLWQLRPPKPEDAPFLFNSWLKSFRDSPASQNLSHTVYYREMHKCIDALFRSPNVNVVLACQPDDPNVIFGYGVAELVGDTAVIHWIYSKHPFRSFGMARDIEKYLLDMPHKDVEFSCWSKMTKSLVKNRPNYTYNPWRLWCHK